MMNKTARQQQIIELIAQSDGQKLGTRELAQRFGVTEMTVRRDFHELAQRGLFRREYGGVLPVEQTNGSVRKEIGFWLVSKTGKYTDPFFNAVLEGADRRLQELGYRVTYVNARSAINTVEHAHNLFTAHPVDGIILVGNIGLECIDYLKTHVRAIVKTTDSIGPDLDTVTFDGYYGMQEVVKHLAQRGYKRLGFIAGNVDLRYTAFLDSVRQLNLPDNDELRMLVPYGLDGWTPELGHIGARQLMRLAQPPDAIVCASDRIAIGVIQWCYENGINVPRDIAVTGFDNISDSEFTTPALTTVHVHKQLIGELAAERVVRRIENPQEVPLFIQTPTALVIRKSSGHEG
jgi:LacI family transcriptional regulator